MQAGKSGVLRQFCWVKTPNLRPKVHGVEPRPTLHIDMCSAVCGGAFFGSQSSDAMVLRRLFSVRCLSPTPATVLLVDGGRQRFGCAINPLKDIFVNFFYVGCFLLLCHDSCTLWNCLVWTRCVVSSNII
ncbi:hypothetical protein VPH35_137875 [Triticum aestivum]